LLNLSSIIISSHNSIQLLHPKLSNIQILSVTFIMKFTIAVIASMATIVLATPVELVERQVAAGICNGLTGTAQCCATDVLGVADLDCANRE
jgi:Fungal hydrophobin